MNKVNYFLRKIILKINKIIGADISLYDAPIGDDYYGKKAKIYDNHRSDSVYWRNEDLSLIDYLNRINNIKSVLDAPFGTGRFLSIYREHNLSVTAVDSSQDMLNIAYEKFPIAMRDVKVLIQKVEFLPFEDGYFDLIVCYRFIPWIVSLGEANLIMKEFSRVCGKYLIIELCVGNHPTGTTIQDLAKTMWNKYNYEEIANWLLSFNFKIIDHRLIYDDVEHPGLTIFICEKSSSNYLI